MKNTCRLIEPKFARFADNLPEGRNPKTAVTSASSTARHRRQIQHESPTPTRCHLAAKRRDPQLPLRPEVAIIPSCPRLDRNLLDLSFKQVETSEYKPDR